MLTRIRHAVANFARPSAPIREELAPLTGGADITRGLVDGFDLLPPADTLASRDGGLWLDTYVRVLDDPQVFAALQQRRLAMLATEWEVIPASARRADRKAADLVKAIIAALPWDQISGGLHYGVFFGHAVAECLWARDGSDVFPDQIRVRDPRRFAYRPTGELALLTTSDPLGVTMPARKFWAFRTGSWTADEPYGMGIAHWVYWPAAFKRGIAKLWLVNLDKHASPTAVGKFSGAPSEAERSKLLAALAGIRSQSAIILPEGQSVELLAAARAGTADYLAAQQYWDACISKVVLGHAAGADSTPGRLGGEDNAQDVRADLVKADADLINASANATWVRWVTEWSVPGASPPKVWRRTEEDEDLAARAERDAKVFTLGYRPTLAQVVETYGGEWEAVSPAASAAPMAAETDAEPPAEPQAPDAEPAPAPAPDPEDQPADDAAFAAPSAPPDPLAKPLARLEREAAPHIAAMLAQIREELAQAQDLAAFAARLEGLYADLGTDGLVDTLAWAFVAAELGGQEQVAREQGAGRTEEGRA